MHNVIIKQTGIKYLPQREIRAPRARYMQYFTDLHALYKEKPDLETFYEGSQYTYSELGEAILDEYKNIISLKELDLLICAYWSFEFDPDHASCGAYFTEKYQLNARILDVCEHGTMAPFMGIKIISQFLQAPAFEKALLLVLEQTTTPRNKTAMNILPQNTGAGIIYFEKDALVKKNNITIIAADILLENFVYNLTENCWRYFIRYCARLNIEISTVLFCLRNGSSLYKLQNYSSFVTPRLNIVCADLFTDLRGCLPMLDILNKNIQTVYQNSFLPANRNISYIFLIDEDVESLCIGFLVLKITKEKL